MASKLSIYNDALRLCSERKLTSLTENREAKRLLDAAWSDGRTEGSVKRCLEMGQWAFARRTQQTDYSPSITPSFGYRYAFNQPNDMVRVCGVFQDEYCTTPLLQYVDERRYWYADLQTIYVQFVSNDISYGADLSLWPETFAKTVAADLAHEIVGNLTQDDKTAARVVREWTYWMKEAKAIDAMNRPTQYLPQGSWLRSRLRGSRYDSRSTT